MRGSRTAVALVVLAMTIGACSSTLTGRGGVGAASGSASSSVGRSSGPAPANRFARTPVSTAIGDPVTLDFCAAISLSALQQPGYEVSFTPLQYVPGCGIRLTRPGSSGHLSVFVFVSSGAPTQRTGRATTSLSGLTAYRFPYVRSSGDCERDVVASGVTVKITAVAASFTSSAALSCSGTEATAGQLARAMAGHSLPRLSVASPSLTSLDACAIARAADLAAQPLLAGSSPSVDDFGIGCGFVGKVTFYLDPVIEKAATPAGASPVRAGGHTLYADDGNGSSFCSFASVQGHTSSGAIEELLGYMTPTGTSDLPAGACDAAQAMVVKYLDAAGLN